MGQGCREHAGVPGCLQPEAWKRQSRSPVQYAAPSQPLHLTAAA